ncbi:MAG: hypothetical protein HQL84_08445 [Magnetococcales bacterium]|nr:hypothetical protein [Magnetococcales bacterium]MBF0150059.1 hypothetical protein [Magnetococcales bacterium]
MIVRWQQTKTGDIMEEFHRLRKEEISGDDTDNPNKTNEDDDVTRIIPKDLLDEIAALHIPPKGNTTEDKS